MCRSPTGGYWVGLGLAEKLTRAGCPVTLCVEGLFAGQTFHGYVRDTMVGNLHWRGRTLLSGQISRERFAVTKSEENLAAICKQDHRRSIPLPCHKSGPRPPAMANKGGQCAQVPSLF
jgi:hypothetical protein